MTFFLSLIFSMQDFFCLYPKCLGKYWGRLLITLRKKNEILGPPFPPCYKFSKKIFFSLFDLLQNLRPPSPLKSERNK